MSHIQTDGRAAHPLAERHSGLEVLQVLEQVRVLRVPVERLAGVGAGRRLVGCEDRAERTVRLLRDRLDRQTEAPADDRCHVTYGVALVGHRAPRGSCWSLLAAH